MKKVIIGWIVLLFLVSLALIFFIWQDSFSFLFTTGDKWLATAIVLIAALVLSHLHNLIFLLLNKIVRFNFKLIDNSHIDADDKKTAKKKKTGPFSDLQQFAHERYGRFWRRKLKKCFIIGKEADVNKLLPDLTIQGWQIGDDTLMIYGGELQDELNGAWLQALKKTCGRIWLLRRKPIDAVVWVLPADYLIAGRKQTIALEQAALQMRERNKLLGWAAPLYLVDTRQSSWSQAGRLEQSVGVLFSDTKQISLDDKMAALAKLSDTCSERGMWQVTQQISHAFLLQLSQDLAVNDKPRLQKWFTQWASLPQSPRLAGIFFAPESQREERDETLLNYDHYLTLSPTWQTIANTSAKLHGHRMGFQWEGLLCGTVLASMLLTSLGLFTSFYNNRQLIAQSEQLVQQINNGASVSYAEQLNTQYVLQNQLEQLMYRQQESVPLSLRFGLSQNDALLDALWPYYEQVNQQNIAQPFTAWASDYLTRLTAMSPADPERVKWVNSGYEVLKGYLMLGLPEKADGEYLSQFAAKMWSAPDSIEASEWQKVMPELVRFWGDNLVQRSQWANNTNLSLVKDVRQILINQIGVQNAGNTIYQAIMQRASQNYANLSLTQLLGGIDSRMLFTSDDEVPGVYTRKAWESFIKNEIASAAKSRQEQIDWVLSDGGEQVASSISPEMLKQQLTDRYFSDYSASWLLFLNNIQWRQADNVSDVIEQLTLLSDVRQSPLIALMNVIQYQAEVAYSGGGISDNLIRSAQELVKDKNPAKLEKTSEASGPLTPSFGPVLNLLKADNRSELSLQTYLLRVTQVRLKLQNITSSANPQAMAQAMAKSVFQGTSVDLSDTRDYGNLIAANLGEEWSGFGYSMFRQPLEQAWQVILTPAAKSFNDTWQSNIVASWEKSFAGRYPFKDSDNDASLAELARFLRPEAGVIDKFIALELGGVLHKQGDNWEIDPVNSQGLHFTPEFIATLNLFNALSHQLFSSGDAKMSFDLMARSGGNVMRSELVIDKQRLNYFNQMPVWQRFNWPGEDDYSPYAQLSWSTNESSLQLYDYAAGNFAFIRLLESAFVRQIDSSRYELVWKAPRDSDLKYILRTQSGEGPLTLLKLRNFELPKRVFDVNP